MPNQVPHSGHGLNLILNHANDDILKTDVFPWQ